MGTGSRTSQGLLGMGVLGRWACTGGPGDGKWPQAPSTLCPPDVKESRKDVQPSAEGLASSGEAHTGNLARCAELARSQASLQSVSSVGSAHGDEGAGYADICGDYRPLLDNLQDPDNVSLQGGGWPDGAGEGPWSVAWPMCSVPAFLCRG